MASKPSESFNLKTASAYLNNLLLARGLLRNGKPIEFARPSKGDGGSEATMATVINLVHDLVLKRDRDQEQREALATTLRTLRVEVTESATKISRAQTSNEDLTRQLALAQASERAAKSAQRGAELQVRVLREESARLKQSVGQIRASCANDVRKRDVQIQRLKGHLLEQQRGNRSQLHGGSIVVSPGFLVGNASKGTGNSSARDRTKHTSLTQCDNAKHSLATSDPAYSLRQETAEFLTQLGQSLSDENDALIAIVRNVHSTLRALQGLPEKVERLGADSKAGNSTSRNDQMEDHLLHAFPASADELARDMTSLLSGLHGLLTSPNFVPVEEVTVRDEEIQRLRSGWEKMESRWREVVGMMHDWRRRMLDGETMGIDDLRKGFGVGDEDDFGDDIREHEQDAISGDELDAVLAVDSADEADLPPEPSLIASTGNATHDTKPVQTKEQSNWSHSPLHEASPNVQTRSSVRSSSQTKKVPISSAERPSRRTYIKSPIPQFSSKLLEKDENEDDDDDDSIVDTLPMTDMRSKTIPAGGNKATTVKQKNIRRITSERRVRFSASTMAATPGADRSLRSSPSSPPMGYVGCSGTSLQEDSHATAERTVDNLLARRQPTPHRAGHGRRSYDSRSRSTLNARMLSSRLFEVNYLRGADESSIASASMVSQTASFSSLRCELSSKASKHSATLLDTSRKIPQAPSSASNTPVILLYDYIDPLQSLKRRSSPTRSDSSSLELDNETSPRMTVREKLNIAAAEAEAAAVAAGLQLDDLNVGFDIESFTDPGPKKKARLSLEDDDKENEPEQPSEGKMATRRRKSAMGIKGRATRRRKSTLTPEELEKLMFE